MSEIKLLSCPICGKDVYIGTEDYYDHVEKVIVCDSCNLRFYGSYGTEEDLIKEWNTRKPMENIIHSIELARDCTPNEDFKSGCNASLHKIWMEIL